LNIIHIVVIIGIAVVGIVHVVRVYGIIGIGRVVGIGVAVFLDSAGIRNAGIRVRTALAIQATSAYPVGYVEGAIP
jgi:hypothetical protein